MESHWSLWKAWMSMGIHPLKSVDLEWKLLKSDGPHRYPLKSVDIAGNQTFAGLACGRSPASGLAPTRCMPPSTQNCQVKGLVAAYRAQAWSPLWCCIVSISSAPPRMLSTYDKLQISYSTVARLVYPCGLPFSLQRSRSNLPHLGWIP